MKLDFLFLTYVFNLLVGKSNVYLHVFVYVLFFIGLKYNPPLPVWFKSPCEVHVQHSD